MTDDRDLPSDERMLLAALGRLPAVEPPADLRERFRARARLEQAEQMAPAEPERAARVAMPSRRPWMGMALAASLTLTVASGWWLDRQRREAETGKLRAELALALKDLSAATRMQGIATAEQAAVRDSGIADALIEALLRDSNTNVRLAAAEALAIVASPETFARGAGQALATERSPFVQAALLSGSERLSPATRTKLLQILLARPDLDSDLRARATKQSSTL